MSWQEELRKLDEELAAGQISADDYRMRRDQVLSSAVSAGPEVKPAHPQQDATQFVQRPLAPPPPQPPQPPPPPPPQQQGEEDADKTQIVPGDADRTQAVGGWQTARPTDIDRTQVVPGVPPQAHAGGQPPRPAPSSYGAFQQPAYPQPPGWQDDDASPPWADSSFPPLAAPPTPDWIRQGPEVFETDRPRAGRIVAIVVAVVVVAGLGVGGFFLLRNNDDSQAVPPPSTSSASPTSDRTSRPPTTTSAAPKRPIAQPDGSSLVDSTFNLQRLGEVKILSNEDFTIMQRNRITEADVLVTKEGELTRGTWAFTAPDRATAQQIFTEIDQLYRQVNFQPVPGISKEGVTALYFVPAAGTPGTPTTVYRGHYLAGNRVIRVEVYGPDGAVAGSEFAELLDDQLRVLPARG